MDNQNYLIRLKEKISNYKKLSERDAEKIVESMKLAKMNTFKDLYSSKPFTKLLIDAFDHTSDILQTLRKGVIDIAVGLAEDQDDRRSFMKSEVIHQLVICSLLSCGESAKESPRLINMSKKAVEILYKASSITDSPYMDKLIPDQKKFQQKMIQWGGFAAMFYVDRNSKLLKKACEELKIRKYIKGKKLEATINSVKVYLKSKRDTLPKICSPEENKTKHETLFPEYII